MGKIPHRLRLEGPFGTLPTPAAPIPGVNLPTPLRVHWACRQRKGEDATPANHQPRKMLDSGTLSSLGTLLFKLASTVRIMSTSQRGLSGLPLVTWLWRGGVGEAGCSVMSDSLRPHEL